jgi:hypothetical protein
MEVDMAVIVGTSCTRTLAPITATSYTVLTASIDPSKGHLIRVGRDAGTSAGSSRASVAIGFGSPSGDTGVTRLDLNDILVPHPQATFLMRVAGNAMHDFGIDGGDLVLIDRASRRPTAMWSSPWSTRSSSVGSCAPKAARCRCRPPCRGVQTSWLLTPAED